MQAPGVKRGLKDSLHFLSNYSQGENTGPGDVNIIFEDGRATVVNASVDAPGKAGQLQFVWNAYAAPPLGEEFARSTKNFGRQPFCSDFSGKPSRCKSGNIEDELTLLQMQFGSNKAELLEVLETACNTGQGITVSDPAGECDRLRKRLQ
jgi:hypothetical protein